MAEINYNILKNREITNTAINELCGNPHDVACRGYGLMCHFLTENEKRLYRYAHGECEQNFKSLPFWVWSGNETHRHKQIYQQI